MKFHDVEQNTDEWFDWKAGKISSSNLNFIMANYPNAFGAPAKKYAIKIATERITGKYINDSYFDDNMAKGHEQEPIARQLYEQTFFTTVSNGGFFCDDWCGCSPDGLVGNDGGIEIKNRNYGAHYDNVKRQSFEPSSKWQCFGNLLFTGRDWWEIVSFCPEFPEDKRLYVYRIHKKDCQEEFQMIQSRLCEFRALVTKTKNNILESNYFIQ